MPQKSRIYPALLCSAAIHRGAEPKSVTTFLNHPGMEGSAVHHIIPSILASLVKHGV